MRWNEHPDLLWKSFTDTTLPLDPSKSKRIDDLEIGGVLGFDLGPCGEVELDLDAEGYHYLLPNNAVTALILLYQQSDDSIYMFVNVLSTEYVVTIPGMAQTSTSLETTANVQTTLFPLGHVPAPKGISAAPPTITRQ